MKNSHVAGALALSCLIPMHALGQVCSWSTLPGDGAVGVNGWIFSLGKFAEPGSSVESLFVGGEFTEAGGATANRIARWNGSEWSPLVDPSGAIGVSGEVHCMQVYDDGAGPALYIGGFFTHAGDVQVNRIAKWDGTAWSALPGPEGIVGVQQNIMAMAVYDPGDGSGPGLYAAGRFFNAGGVPASYIARWDANGWSPLGLGLNDSSVFQGVRALAVFDDGSGPCLYAGGRFMTAGGKPAPYIARWDGKNWSPVLGDSGAGLNGPVSALHAADDGSGMALYAGGMFTTADGEEARGNARWDGNDWSPVLPALTQLPSEPLLGVTVLAMHDVDNGTGHAMYLGGALGVGPGGEQFHRIVRRDASGWSGMGSGFNGSYGWIDPILVRAIESVDHGDGNGVSLYAAGSFAFAGQFIVSRIARWNCITTPCPADLDGNGTIDTNDLGILLAAFGCAGAECTGDIDGNGVTDAEDLGILLNLFGANCK